MFEIKIPTGNGKYYEGTPVDSSDYGKSCFGLSTQFLEASRRYALAKVIIGREADSNDISRLSLLCVYLEFMTLECLMKAILEVDCKHAKELSNLKKMNHNLFSLLEKVEEHLKQKSILLSLDDEERAYFDCFKKDWKLVYETVKYGFLLTKDRKHFSSFAYTSNDPFFPKLCDKFFNVLMDIREEEWEIYKKENPEYKREVDDAIVNDNKLSRKNGFIPQPAPPTASLSLDLF